MQGIQNGKTTPPMTFNYEFFRQPESRPAMPLQPPAEAFQLWRPTTWPALCRTLRETPVYFDPARYDNIVAFTRSREFTRFRFQFNRTINDIQTFYARSGRDSEAVERNFETFRHHLFNGYFADHMPLLYTEGKKMLETIAAEISRDTLPLERRLDLIRNLATGVTECSGGTLSNLQDTVTSLTSREDALPAFALASKRAMVDAAILDFIKTHHAYAIGNEIHYVNAYRHSVGEVWGLPPRHDPFRTIVQPSGDDILACIDHVSGAMTPQRLLDFLTDSFMQDMQSVFDNTFQGCKLPLSFAQRPEEAERFRQYMEKLDAYDKTSGARFGGMPPLHAFLALDEAGNLIGLRPQTTLLILEFLRRLQSAGMISHQAEIETIERLPNGDRVVHLAEPMLIWIETDAGPQVLTSACLARMPAATLAPRLRERMLRDVIPCEPGESLMSIDPDWLCDLPDEQTRDAFFKRLGPGLLCRYVARYSPLPGELADALFRHAIAAYARNSRDLLHRLLEGGNQAGQQHMLAKALHRAILVNDAETVEKISQAGVDINVAGRHPPGYTPLITAIMQNKTEMVRKLLALGARVEVPSAFHACPIEYAVNCADVDILRLLLEHSPQEHLRQKCIYADTMLLNCDEDAETRVPLLIQYFPLDFTAVDDNDHTFLMRVLSNLPPPRLLRVLVNQPAVRQFINVKNHAGKTVLDVATRDRFNPYQANVLREAGALPGDQV